jgi:hypothetical protein
LKGKIKDLTTQNENLAKEKKQKELNNNNNIMNSELDNSYTLNRISELEEEIEKLKTKNNNNLSELKNKSNKIEELTEIIKNKDKELEQNKNKELNANNIINEDSSQLLHKVNIEEYEKMKKEYETALKDCDNYKIINNKFLEDINEKDKVIEELKNNNYLDEINEKDKNISSLKDIILEKDTLNNELTQKLNKLENELKIYRREDNTERNPFKKGKILNEEFGLQKGDDFRYSMGAKENIRLEKYKKMALDYENQIGNDLSQMNMLKSDIKSLKNNLKEKEKTIREMKQLIEIGYKGINPSNKAQKEAVKKLQEYLKNE